MATNRLLEDTIKTTTKAIALRVRMMELRRRILTNIRRIVKDNKEAFEKEAAIKETDENCNIRWMMDKMKRGYFGTDVRTEQLPELLEDIKKVLDKN